MASFLTTPLWQTVQQTYASIVKKHWQNLMRHRMARRILQIVGVLIALYVLVVGVNAVAIYHYKATNRTTRFIEHLFPYPAAFADGSVVPLNRYRLEVEARSTYSASHNLQASVSETQTFVINQLVDRVLYQHALDSHHIKLDENALQKQLDDIYSQVGGQAKLAEFLKAQYGPNVSLDLFQTWMREAAVESAVQNELLTQATVRHILVAVAADATPDQIEAARVKAAGIKASITSPDQFATVAKNQSDDVASRDKGGEFGTTNRGDDQPVLSADFENAIFTLPVGQISDPIRTPFGWHIVQVEKRTGSIDLSKKAYTAQLVKNGGVHIFIP